jgi:4-hydroxy-4-methyl-2-oxoglutarate aldolase
MAGPHEDFTQLFRTLQRASASAAYEAMGRQGDVLPVISALVDSMLCVGPAYTVRSVAGDADEIVRAADLAPSGAVIVIDIGEPGVACTWGGTGTLVAQRRGIAGVVSNGRVRDINEIRRARFPVFAKGTTVSGWTRGRSGEAGVPVSIGGQLILPGDLICADDDGVAVIPRQRFQDMLHKLEDRLDFEATASQMVSAGSSYAEILQRKPARLQQPTDSSQH